MLSPLYNFFTPTRDQENWKENNFRTEVLSTDSQRYEHYVDLESSGVTLACDDIQMHAHKMISKQICTTLKKPNPKNN